MPEPRFRRDLVALTPPPSVLLAVLLPPLAVYRRAGRIGPPFWLACLLTLAFYVPGVLFAVWIQRKPRR